MRLSLSVKVGGVDRKLGVLLESVRDLSPVLKEFSKVKREEIRERFQSGGPGWAPKAATTIRADIGRLARAREKAHHSAIRNVEKGLVRQLASAEKRVAKASTIARRKEELRVLAILRGPSVVGTDKAFVKTAEKLFTRALKKHKVPSGLPLGRIANSISAKLEKAQLTFASKVPWAGVHNEGGVVGNKARLPARPFLEWTEEDLGTLAEMLQERMMLAWT